jgi:hypothetical protein
VTAHALPAVSSSPFGAEASLVPASGRDQHPDPLLVTHSNVTPSSNVSQWQPPMPGEQRLPHDPQCSSSGCKKQPDWQSSSPGAQAV